MKSSLPFLGLVVLAGAAAGCGATARLTVADGTGPQPALRSPVDVLTGFVRENGDAMGRPVGAAIDGRRALPVADDVGNVIWRVAAGPR